MLRQRVIGALFLLSLMGACGLMSKDSNPKPGADAAGRGGGDASGGGDAGADVALGGFGGSVSDAGLSDAFGQTQGGAPPEAPEGFTVPDDCECNSTMCRSMAEVEFEGCLVPNTRAGVERISWEGCPYVGVSEVLGHWAATYVYDENGNLVGFGGGDGFAGAYYSCGDLAPCGDAAETRCALCGQVYGELPVLCHE